MVRLLPVAMLLLAACAPDAKPPVKVRALVLSSSGTYAPQEVELTSLEDVVELRGAVASLVGGARIRMDGSDPDVQAATTADGLAIAIVKDVGRPVSVSYVAQGGVLWPADFHSWNMVTTYYNLERAWDYFRVVGNVPAAEIEPTTVYYFPEFSIGSTTKSSRDNAIYFPLLQSMLVLPFEQIQSAPLAINAGVLAHEYSHRVFNGRVYSSRRIPDAFNSWGQGSPTPALNLLKSLDEGLADYHAFGATCQSVFGCNPRFLNTSFSAEITHDRDFSRRDVCLDATLRQQMLTTSYDTFVGREYKVGTIIAAALYHAGEPGGHREALQRAVLDAYSDLGELINTSLGDQSRFNLNTVANVLASHVTDNDLRTALCNQLLDRLQLQLTDVPACPSTSAGGTDCPNINP